MECDNILIMSEPILFAEHRIIGRGASIIGGIFLSRAAVLVDYAEYPVPYDQAYTVMDNMLAPDQKRLLLPIAKTINMVVRKFLPFSANPDHHILRNEAQVRGIDHIDRSHVVGLSKFILDGGNCQQQALLGGALIELHENKYGIEGEVSIYPPPSNKDIDDRHVELRYMLGNQTVRIESPINSISLVGKPIEPGINDRMTLEEIEQFFD